KSEAKPTTLSLSRRRPSLRAIADNDKFVGIQFARHDFGGGAIGNSEHDLTKFSLLFSIKNPDAAGPLCPFLRRHEADLFGRIPFLARRERNGRLGTGATTRRRSSSRNRFIFGARCAPATPPSSFGPRLARRRISQSRIRDLEHVVALINRDGYIC